MVVDTVNRICHRGNTRVVYGEDGKKRTQVADVGKFDPASIPKEKWDDYRKKRAADAFSKEERPANNIRRGNQPVYRSHFGRSRSSLLLKSKRASSDGLPEYPGNKVLGLARSGQASRPTSPCPDTVNPLAGGSRSPPPLSLPEGPGYGYAQTCEARMGGGQPVPMTQLFTAPLYARLPAPVHPGMMYYSDPNSIPPEMGYLVNGQYHRDAMPIRTVSYPAVLESLQRQASISGNTVMGIPRHFGAGASSDNRDTYEGEMRMHPTQPCGIGNSSGDTLPQTVPTTLNANGEAPLEQNTSTAETLSRVSEQLRRQTMSPVLEDNCIRPSSKRGSSGPDKTSNSDTEFSPDKQHANRSTVSGTSRPLFPMPHPMERRASEIRFSGMVYKRPTGEGAEQGDERGPLEGSRPTSPDPWRSEGIEVIHEEGTRFPTDGQLLDKVRQIVESGNIMILTKRDVRDHLSEHFGVDVTPKRHLVNNYIDELLSSMVENHQDSR
ncbi:hypothetical protein BC832DRAFT_136848 [Gaertneriomyces semiglobifer]|nr:hypothetical protein BC832DRAFT_136848 [Gaertneriomyces semiglobifer]